MRDKLFFNGKIITSEDNIEHEAVLIKFNTIYKMGEPHDLLEFVDRETDIINLNHGKITIEEIKEMAGI
ncbi:hypothetical protein SAMN04487886_11601 [Clostridium sp. DSM 8431]|uniref:hypothetical protein n=1 Tax=Clostridium sp. DSM 8431 TaxID=1761781 RepID=UPI0008EA34E7|nr:hypothetical protein [Clostridium sp. DSM 8431]SFU78559.1 hypothetical protein SAMN04487886_11601 [Clostridium sp. DSM 8431]